MGWMAEMHKYQSLMTSQSKKPMTYTYLSQTERYQINVLMKAGQTQTEIAHILGRLKSTISREVARGSGRRGYRPRQAQHLSDERSQCSRKVAHIDEQNLNKVRSLLSLQWSPEQMASKLLISHETIYHKAMDGHLWRSLRCQKQKRKRCAGGRNRRWQIPDRRSITERPESIQ
jgi:IS30 family transposase